MALDGVFLRHIKKELEEKLMNSKMDKIYQPAKDELILSMRSKEGNYRLLLSARANSPRINLTENSYENPKVPPMFCMLLRKRLSGARLRKIIQPELERILILEFEAVNELGDTVLLKLVIEIMGQYSNIIFLDEENQIIDSVKRVDASMSSQRLVLPGMKYEVPPKQNKICLLTHESQDIFSQIKNFDHLEKTLLNLIQGVSPVICREISHLADRNFSRLEYFLKRETDMIRNISGEPYIIYDENDKPIDFSYEYIEQYGSGHAKKQESFCKLLDEYYFEKDLIESIKNKSEDLRKIIHNNLNRLAKKMQIQSVELKNCDKKEDYKIYGDLINANLYQIQKGEKTCILQNFYDNMQPIEISLEPSLSASENAQLYYKKYRKAKTAENILKIQLEECRIETEYITSVQDSLDRAVTVRELDEIRTELAEQGYLKNRKNSKKAKKDAEMPPLEFISESHFKILVGRNNKQNDKLTMKTADKNDLWFHVKDFAGSHTVIICNGKEPDEQTILYAAKLAALHSKAKDSGKAAVDYTKIRYVSKPQGAKPGMVIYKNQKTIFVSLK